ncbi:putative transcription factor bZIP family [Helianthus anomalus]
MVNGILQWIRRIFRLKPFLIKLALTRTDGLGKSNGGDTSSVSPVPYVLNGVFRGRKNGAVEKVVERRQRKTIKNRESAARSRARKQVGMLNIAGFRFISFSFF